jgi:hypothetical protein
MSGRLQASGAGLRSSVLVSPLTLKTVTVSFSGTSGLEVNHCVVMVRGGGTREDGGVRIVA